MTIISSKMC